MVNLLKQNPPLSIETQINLDHLSIDSILADLPSYTDTIEISCLTKQVINKFKEDAITPGIILVENGEFYSMISRRRFLERMSRPYALDIFSKRPISLLYNAESTHLHVEILSANIPILKAARLSLRRSAEFIYEPLVIQKESGEYALIDVPQLLYAQSHLHKLTHQLLKEQTHTHMVQNEKMASLGRMVAGIAHEIRNPVNCIYGNIEFLENYFGDLLGLINLYQQEIKQPPQAIADFIEAIELDFLEKDLQKVIQSIQVSSERTARIVTNLRNFSHIDEKVMQVISIPECINGTLLILNSRIKNTIQVQTDYEANLPDITGYSGQLSQVFMNLIVNAIDALEEKIEATKELSNSTWQPTITISATAHTLENSQRKNWLCINIIDNADGIPEDVQIKLFQDFFTTKPAGKGTGLGLTISREIITEKHQGRLELSSKLGVGSTFSVWLPIINNAK